MRFLKALLTLFTLMTSCSGTGFQTTYTPSNEECNISLSGDYEDFCDCVYNLPFLEARKLLLDNLNEENVPFINNLAIKLGFYKPMYHVFYIPDLDNPSITEADIYYTYYLEYSNGNESYQKALDNFYFRKALMALFTHDDLVNTTYKRNLNTFYSSENYRYEKTFKTSQTIPEFNVKEGINEAKAMFDLAIKNGLSNDPIELYCVNNSQESIDVANNLKNVIVDCFGDRVKIVMKHCLEMDYYNGIFDNPEYLYPTNFFSNVNTQGYYRSHNGIDDYTYVKTLLEGKPLGMEFDYHFINAK